MSTRTTDYAQTRRAVSNRARKATVLVEAAVALGVVTCELRLSHPDRAASMTAIRKAAGVGQASADTWRLVLEQLDARLLAAASGRCAQCSSPVLQVAAGMASALTLDPLPHPVGEVVVRRVDGQALSVVLLRPSDPRPAGSLHRLHHRCCPMSTAVRQRQSRRRRCLACRMPLHVALPPDVVMHPGCDEPHRTEHRLYPS